MKLGAAVFLDNFLPLWRVFELAQVWFDFARQNFQSGSLTDSVLANEAQDLTEARNGLRKLLENYLNLASS